MLKNYQNTHCPRFSFTPKTGIAFPKTGVLFLLPNLTFDCGGYDYWRLWMLAGTAFTVLKFVCGCRQAPNPRLENQLDNFALNGEASFYSFFLNSVPHIMLFFFGSLSIKSTALRTYTTKGNSGTRSSKRF